MENPKNIGNEGKSQSSQETETVHTLIFLLHFSYIMFFILTAPL